MPVASEFRSRILSAKLICDVLIVVVVPETVKLPPIVALPDVVNVVPEIAAVPAPMPDVIALST